MIEGISVDIVSDMTTNIIRKPLIAYPNLTNPIVQHKIHDGRKRIDITYTNMAVNGFFKWVATHYPAPHIFVECKNYGREVGNPELDQLSGRFSPSRGQIGILVCRSFQNEKRFLKGCADTARDFRGFILLWMMATSLFWPKHVEKIRYIRNGTCCSADFESW